ncbi:peroxisomal membrane protein 11C isoform X2 [Cephus cinctus]|uniref:Peroxisomal membrane protein 11C isoform X2 n=1 Tax=Cephus cinctus TaxID=211228 RepID=A0AAJ7BZ97_CEPCN|nr:peroxisomal membrane protein 11C isoform X2 [Cephus cinctus]
MNLALVSEYLNTYPGRDKMLRTLSYVAKLVAGLSKSPEAAEKFKIIGSQMSSCRVTLRLLDDIPMLHYAMSYGLGKQEPDWLIRWMELIQIVVDTIFYPVEHICWAGEHKVISIDTLKWDDASTLFWIVSLYLSLFKLKQLEKHKMCLSKTNCDVRVTMGLVQAQQRNELLTSLRLVLDVSYAVSYLPSGVLWGGRFKTWHVGALGTISSLIGLYQAFSKQIAQQKNASNNHHII